MVASHTTVERGVAALTTERDVAMRGPLVVASDGSPAAGAALRLAKALDGRGGRGGVRVVTALERLAAAGPGPETTALDVRLDDERRDYLQALIREQVEHAAPASGWQVETQWGRPAHVIARCAESHGASFVLLGLTRHSRLHRLLAGETALEVIQRSKVPVLLVAPDVIELPRTIVVGVDFSVGSIAAARAALDLLAPGGGRLVLVHVRPVSEMPADRWEAWDVAYAAGVPALLEQVRSAVGERTGVRVETAQLRGDARRDLLEHARRLGADVLAVASHGRGVVERTLAGSTTTGALHHARCSLLVIPPFAGGRSLGVRYADSAETGNVK